MLANHDLMGDVHSQLWLNVPLTPENLMNDEQKRNVLNDMTTILGLVSLLFFLSSKG